MTGFPLALPSAATVRTITPENSWVVVEGRYIGPITAPPGTEDFNRQYRDLAARVTSAPPGPGGQDCAPVVPPGGESYLWQQYRALSADAGCLLGFQLGGYITFFFDEAAIVSPILDIAIARGTPPACGIPMGAGARFAARCFELLLQAGHDVAFAGETGWQDGRMQRRILARMTAKRAG